MYLIKYSRFIRIDKYIHFLSIKTKAAFRRSRARRHYMSLKRYTSIQRIYTCNIVICNLPSKINSFFQKNIVLSVYKITSFYNQAFCKKSFMASK